MIAAALGQPSPAVALKTLLDRLEQERAHSKAEVFATLQSFLPTENDAHYEALADELDRFVGMPPWVERRWPDEPDLS